MYINVNNMFKYICVSCVSSASHAGPSVYTYTCMYIHRNKYMYVYICINI